MVNQDNKLQMKLAERQFVFSKRMLNFLQMAEIHTVRDLTAIPLRRFTCFKGFKTKCSEELKAFIEFEQLEDLFKLQ